MAAHRDTASPDAPPGAEPPRRPGLRLAVGSGLAALSYPLWGAAIALGIVAAHRGSRAWAHLALGCLVLNWVCFGLGILVAGRPAAVYARRLVLRILRRKPKPGGGGVSARHPARGGTGPSHRTPRSRSRPSPSP